jgi:hypothetical protein
MLRTGEEDEVPPKFDQEGNPINIEERSKLGASNLQCSKLGASNAPTLEDHMKKLEKLKVENKKLRAEERKPKYTPPQAKTVTPKRKSPRRGGTKESSIRLLTTLCPSITIPCHLPLLILLYLLAKLPASTGRIIINGSIA